jgi:ribosomal protein S18 acetylase RimI-like enzyme
MQVVLSKFDPSKIYTGQKAFDCENKIINDFVQNSLKQQVKRGISVAHVLTDSDDQDRFAGFYTLIAASIGRENLAGIASHSLPPLIGVSRLSMLGVSKRYEGNGFGRQLLRHAIRMTVSAAESMGLYGLYLDANPGAVDFYRKLNFETLTPRQNNNPTPMFLHIDTARMAIREISRIP